MYYDVRFKVTMVIIPYIHIMQVFTFRIFKEHIQNKLLNTKNRVFQKNY